MTVLYTFGIAVTTLLGVNLDLLAVLAPTLWSTRKRLSLAAGCAAGNSVIVGASIVIASGMGWLPGMWARWAGVVPLAIGVTRLFRRPPVDEVDAAQGPGTALACAAITITLGLDNIAVLAPVLRAQTTSGATLIATVNLAAFPALILAVAYLGQRLLGRTQLPPRTAGGLTAAAGVILLARQLII